MIYTIFPPQNRGIGPLFSLLCHAIEPSLCRPEANNPIPTKSKYIQFLIAVYQYNMTKE
jgi:hypothetical protein